MHDPEVILRPKIEVPDHRPALALSAMAFCSLLLMGRAAREFSGGCHSSVSFAPFKGRRMGEAHSKPHAPDRNNDARAELEKFEADRGAGRVCKLKCLQV